MCFDVLYTYADKTIYFRLYKIIKNTSVKYKHCVKFNENYSCKKKNYNNNYYSMNTKYSK